MTIFQLIAWQIFSVVDVKDVNQIPGLGFRSSAKSELPA